MKLLLHACCAPCSIYCIDALRKECIEPEVYWYNPNIHPYKEYEARRNCLIEYTKKIGVKCIVKDEYGLDEFCKSVANKLDSRCVDYCYPIRLRKTFEYAVTNGYDTVSTTLLYSIYQNHEFIKAYSEKLSKEFGIEFLYRDFRVGFWEGHEKAKEEGLYMQKYCGCIFSEEDRYLKTNVQKQVLPDNLEFLPVEKNMVIKKEKDNKEQYMKLLLEADPEKEVVEKYLKDGELFVLTYKEEVVCVSVVTKVDDTTCELKNIATKEKYRVQGYGKKMIKFLIDNYKQKYEKMIVGTSENNIPFYVKQGFDRYEKTIKNFFVDNYKEEIIDGNTRCIDMYYYSKDLNKEQK